MPGHLNQPMQIATRVAIGNRDAAPLYPIEERCEGGELPAPEFGADASQVVELAGVHKVDAHADERADVDRLAKHATGHG